MTRSQCRGGRTTAVPFRSAILRRGGTAAVMLLLALIRTTGEGLADDWAEQEFAKFRLLGSSTAMDRSGAALIGLEVKLESGWQFYYESPGEFAVPPEFDWSASRNLASAVVEWPRPAEYHYGETPAISTLGYKDAVLLPIEVEALAADRDLEVHLNLSYAVCEEICVADQVALRLIVPAGPGHPTPHGLRLERALADIRGLTE